MIDINNIGGDIKLKTRNELIQKEFMKPKDNKYRVKKLIQLTESLKRPDVDIELDEMKFTKLKKYRDYPLVKLTLLELKKILANYSIRDDEEIFLNFLGISKLGKDVYSLQLDIYVDKFIKINLKEITFEENLDLIFRMFDKDKNDKITKNESFDLISFFHKSNSLGFDEDTLGHLIDVIFRQIDKSNQGFISKQSLRKYLENYKDEDITINPFTKVKTSDAVTRRKRLDTQKISSEEEKVLERINRKKDRSKLWKFWVLNKKMIIWSIIYFAMCLITGLINRNLEGGRQYGTTKAARFFAGVIFFSLACLIVYMCDAPITFLSSTFLKYYLPLNDPKHYHIVCAVVLAVATIPHVLIHIFGDFSQIAAICARNPKKSYVTVAWLTFANLTGITGVLSLIIFSIMIIVPFVQRLMNKRYELFLHTHKLFYLAMVVLFLHARTPDTKRWPYVVFLGFPLLLFIIELLIRVVRYFLYKSKILRVKFLQSGVILLELQKPKYFKFRCGQYAQINISKISKYQWHPFTFASSPNDDSLFFYINPVGDWTSELKKLSYSNLLYLLKHIYFR
jgi:hypothetical protein